MFVALNSNAVLNKKILRHALKRCFVLAVLNENMVLKNVLRLVLNKLFMFAVLNSSVVLDFFYVLRYV